MEISTSIPVLTNSSKILTKIENFWDKLTPAWQAIWGPHIHHGFYEEGQICPPQTAQEKLLEKICQVLKPQPNHSILDVGCGMGGSAIYLAKIFQSQVTGISLSQKQLAIAKDATKLQNLSTLSYRIEDAHTLKSIDSESFDIVWSLESCEQFYNKDLFIEQAFRVLKPGGRLMLATWCADQEYYQGQLAKDYLKLCSAFDLPYMPSQEHYRQILEKYFTIETLQDWSINVKNSWQYAIEHLKHYSILQLLKLGGIRGMLFIRSLNLMNRAFQSGQIRYGFFIAKKVS